MKMYIKIISPKIILVGALFGFLSGLCRSHAAVPQPSQIYSPTLFGQTCQSGSSASSNFVCMASELQAAQNALAFAHQAEVMDNSQPGRPAIPASPAIPAAPLSPAAPLQ